MLTLTIHSDSRLSLKVQANTVDAVAESGGLGTVVEDVPQMGVTIAANHLHAYHSMRSVRPRHHVRLISIVNGIGEGRPPGARFEFGIGTEELALAAFAQVISDFFVMDIFAGERWFRSSFATHVIFFSRESFHPILVRHFLLFRQIGGRHRKRVLMLLLLLLWTSNRHSRCRRRWQRTGAP